MELLSFTPALCYRPIGGYSKRGSVAVVGLGRQTYGYSFAEVHVMYESSEGLLQGQHDAVLCSNNHRMSFSWSGYECSRTETQIPLA